MKIVSMTATFGKLDGETLELRPGLNIITAPNEWGKSTWCAFLCAMLYGIDTRERSRGGQLADKERFMPWSGKPMEGTLRVIHEGRDITIQRRTKGRVPLGEFQARETQTGLAVRELTADNCGQRLLGVEKSVFLRTGFLRFSDLPVKADESLRRRLNALVTTGDESGDGERLAAKLRELKNRCRHNHTGLIPACQTELRQLQESLWECQSLQKQHDALCTQAVALEEELDLLENHRLTLQWEQSQTDQRRIEEARADVRAAAMLEQSLREQCADSPDRDDVEAKLRQGELLLAELDLDREEQFRSSGAVLAAALLTALLVAAGFLMADRGLLIPCLVLAALSLAVCLNLAGRHRRQQQLLHSADHARRQGRRNELVTHMAGWRSQLRALDELDRARENVTRTQAHLRDLEAMARSALEPDREDPLTLPPEATLLALREKQQQLEQCRLRLAQLRGRMDQMPGAEQLQTRLSQTRLRLAELEKTYLALGHAQNALETAMQELQRRFAPDITRRAGEYLRRLTDGAYDRISVDDDLTVLAARDTETTLRTVSWRSEGTGDQMYLALRLAVWEVLSPGSPLILDDALIRFDQTRLERAMALLRELGEKRQIILFSCQGREEEYLNR